MKDGEFNIEFVVGAICCDYEEEQPEDDCDLVPIKTDEHFVTANYNGSVNDQFASHNHLSPFNDVLYDIASVVASPEGLAPTPLCIPPNKSQIHSRRTVILQV